MSAWPWMKGVSVAIAATPIDPVNEYDQRPSVMDLIEEHRGEIKEVRKGIVLDPLYTHKKHDDLWILRFVLSHKKKTKAAIAAAKVALAFRSKHELDEKDIRTEPPLNATNPSVRKYFACCKDGSLNFTLPDPRRGVIAYICFGDIDQHKLVETITDKEEWEAAFIHITEWCFQWLDYVTRTTGRLTKTIRLGDTTGMTMADINMEANKRDGQAVAAMDDCYPQLLQTIFCCNPPSWVQVPWRVLRPLLPTRVVSKIDFISPATNEKELKRFWPYVSEEDLPVRFGGKNQTWPVQPLPVGEEEEDEDEEEYTS